MSSTINSGSTGSIDQPPSGVATRFETALSEGRSTLSPSNYRAIMHEALYGWDRGAQRGASDNMNELCHTTYNNHPEVNEIKREWIEITSETNGSQYMTDEERLREHRKRYMNIYERTHEMTDEEKTMFRAIHECSKPDRKIYKKTFMDGIEQAPEPTDERSAKVRLTWSEIHKDVDGRKVHNRERRQRWWNLVGAKDQNSKNSRGCSNGTLGVTDEFKSTGQALPSAETVTATRSAGKSSSTSAPPGEPETTGKEDSDLVAARRQLEEIVKKFGKEWTMSHASSMQSDCKTNGTSHSTQTPMISQEA